MTAAPNMNSTVLVRDIMATPVITATTQMKLWQVAELLTTKKISGAPIMDHLERLVGMASEGMVLRLAAKEGLEATVAHCLKFMGTAADIKTLKPTDTFTEAYKLFLKHNIHRIPVLESNGKIVGIVSRSTIVRIFVEAHYGKAIARK